MKWELIAAGTQRREGFAGEINVLRASVAGSWAVEAKGWTQTSANAAAIINI